MDSLPDVETDPGRPEPRVDLLSLGSAQLPQLLSALDDLTQPLSDDAAGAQPVLRQVAKLVMAEAVRLIRLAGHQELARHQLPLARALGGHLGAAVRGTDLDAFETLTAASAVLHEALSPASKGGEIAVLRSWSGTAADVAVLVNESGEEGVPRARLLDRFGLEQSHLSHVLADLELAGLVVRVRNGRTVRVHCGPQLNARHVQEFLGAWSARQAAEAPLAQQRPELPPLEGERRRMRSVPAASRMPRRGQAGCRPLHLLTFAEAA